MKRKMKAMKIAYEVQREKAIKAGMENIPLPWDEWVKLAETWKLKGLRKERNRRKRGIIEPRMGYLG